MPRTSITLMPLADTFRVTLRPSDATKYVFFCTFGSKRRLVRRCECEMLCPKPGTAPVTWQTAAMVILHYREASASPKVTCRHASPRVVLGWGRHTKKGDGSPDLSMVRDHHAPDKWMLVTTASVGSSHSRSSSFALAWRPRA